jgi:hypothetical protein
MKILCHLQEGDKPKIGVACNHADYDNGGPSISVTVNLGEAGEIAIFGRPLQIRQVAHAFINGIQKAMAERYKD